MAKRTVNLGLLSTKWTQFAVSKMKSCQWRLDDDFICDVALLWQYYVTVALWAILAAILASFSCKYRDANVYKSSLNKRQLEIRSKYKLALEKISTECLNEREIFQKTVDYTRRRQFHGDFPEIANQVEPYSSVVTLEGETKREKYPMRTKGSLKSALAR